MLWLYILFLVRNEYRKKKNKMYKLTEIQYSKFKFFTSPHLVSKNVCV